LVVGQFEICDGGTLPARKFLDGCARGLGFAPLMEAVKESHSILSRVSGGSLLATGVSRWSRYPEVRKAPRQIKDF
jgi:hypothetical protein